MGKNKGTTIRKNRIIKIIYLSLYFCDLLIGLCGYTVWHKRIRTRICVQKMPNPSNRPGNVRFTGYGKIFQKR